MARLDLPNSVSNLTRVVQKNGPAFQPLSNSHPALRRLRSLRSMWGLRLRSLLRSLRNPALVDCAFSG